MRYPHVQHICNLAQIGDVLYVGTTGHGVRNLLHNVAGLNIEGVSITRSRGHELVTFPNGNRLHFATLRTLDKARGRSVWHIITDDHTMLDNEEFRETLRPCFNHPRMGSIERYSVIG